MQRLSLSCLLIITMTVAACGGTDPAGPNAHAPTTPTETEPDAKLCTTLRESNALKAEIWATEDLLDLSEAEVEQLAGTLDDAHRALEEVRSSGDAETLVRSLKAGSSCTPLSLRAIGPSTSI